MQFLLKLIKFFTALAYCLQITFIGVDRGVVRDATTVDCWYNQHSFCENHSNSRQPL